MEVLSKHCRQTSADALKKVEPTEIMMYLIFRIKSSPSSTRKQGIRQFTVYAHYKTFQMVYCLDARRRLEKPTNDMINAVCKPYFKEPRFSSLSPNFVFLSVQSTKTNECLNMHADRKLVYQN